MNSLIKLPEETNYDKILKHVLSEGKYELPAKLKEEFERWKSADDLIRAHGASYKVAKLLAAKHEISEATAYIDIRNCKKFFGTVRGKMDKEYAREMLIDSVQKARKKALELDDLKAYAALSKELRYLYEFDKIEDDTNIAELFQEEIIIVTDPKQVGLEEYDIPALEKKYSEKKQKAQELKPNPDGSFGA